MDQKIRDYTLLMDMMNRESLALTLLEKEKRIPTPLLINKGDNYLLMEYIEGITYYECKDPILLSKVDNQMFDVIKAMKGYEKGSGDLVDPQTLEGNQELIYPIDIRTVQKNWPWIPQPNERYKLSHNDLHGANIIINDEGLAAIIDWEASGFFHPDYEKYKYTKLDHNYTLFLRQMEIDSDETSQNNVLGRKSPLL